MAFFWSHAWSCFFPVCIFSLLAMSKVLPLGSLPRYDFLLLACIVIQAVMLLLKMESLREVLVITLFHLMGVTMEIFKVKMGSWSYPEFAYTKVAGVPLYSGFMYASVASFMCQAWRRVQLRMTDWPPVYPSLPLAVAIYANFFTHHFIVDLRWWLLASVIIVFRKSRVWFYTTRQRWMPVSLSFFLIGFFIWLAENIATFFGAWKYAYQHEHWQVVHTQKVMSWTLMAIVSYIIVAELKRERERKREQVQEQEQEQVHEVV